MAPTDNKTGCESSESDSEMTLDNRTTPSKMAYSLRGKPPRQYFLNLFLPWMAANDGAGMVRVSQRMMKTRWGFPVLQLHHQIIEGFAKSDNLLIR